MVNVYLAYGFEEIEALTAVDILRRGGVDVQLVSVSSGKIVQGAHGISVEADVTFEEADHEGCDMIVLPGGLPGATNLEAHEGLMSYVQNFARSGKGVAAICASPGVVLAPHGILEGKEATVYPGMEDALTNGGAKPVPAGAVTDGNIITGMGPGYAAQFALAVLEYLAGKDAADEVAEGFLVTRQ